MLSSICFLLIIKARQECAMFCADDGGGMDPDGIRKCMSLGYSSKKSNTTIGQCNCQIALFIYLLAGLLDLILLSYMIILLFSFCSYFIIFLFSCIFSSFWFSYSIKVDATTCIPRFSPIYALDDFLGKTYNYQFFKRN